ncbi:alanine racemase [Exiguobacterium antarcticum]|uniref:alanine racemase n=1 Tax=Exiguobacterium antarcticum TaxID=132920 RepID=UPI000285ED7A|nr:alanine racemase [Exiguobacterium antarcticum]AFS71704.1 Alanine racemase 2 [Exiguobacterium antarcticum B7]
MYRPTWIEIDREAIAHNVREIKARMGHQSMMAVVKADGYGHGAITVAEIALANGAEMLAVALLEEAIELREAGIQAPILMLEALLPEHAPIASNYDVAVPVFSAEWLREAKQHLTEIDHLRLHIKVDSGMGRLGLQTLDELDAVLKELDPDLMELDGIYTHFATADELTSRLFEKQQTVFLRFVERVPGIRYIHASNSAAAIRLAGQEPCNVVRIGIALYGALPSDEMSSYYDFLQPAFSLKSRLMQVKHVEPGQTISYGATYTAPTDEWIGTVPIGYADGWSRKFQGYALIVDGTPCEIVGRVCMDRLMIRLPRAYPVGTEVTLIGRGAPIDEAAHWLGTINYEVLCQFSKRVPRI